MSAALAPYNVSLAASSPLFSYTPSRDGDVASTWNASYTGTNVWPSLDSTTRPVGVGYRRTQSGGAKISLSFQGSGLYLCFTANDATFVVTLDGSVVSQDSAQFVTAQNDAGACAGLGAETMFASPGLGAGPHSMLLAIAAASDNEFQFFGGMLTLGVNTKGHNVDDSNIIDDQDLGWNLSGGRVATGGTWDTSVGATLFDKTVTFQCNYGTGSTASYKFTGAGGLILHGNVWKDAHSFSVSLDGATANMDATSSWEDGRTVLFAQGDLDPAAVHTLTVIDYNPDDQSCTNGVDGKFRFCCIGIDSLLLLEAGTKTLTAPSPPSSSNSSNTGTPDPGSDTPHVSSSKSVVGPVIGGVVGGLALAALAILALLFYRRRKRRAAEGVSISADAAQFVAHPWDADTDYGMRYNTGQGSNAATILSSSDAYAVGAPPIVREKQPFFRGAPAATSSNLAASSSADTRSRTESTTTSGLGQPMAPADLERVLAFVAERMDQQRPTAAVPQSEERPPQYRGSM